MYALTIYSPLLVSGCLLIELTETETCEQIDKFIDVVIAIAIFELTKINPEKIKQGLVKGIDNLKAVGYLDTVLG